MIRKTNLGKGFTLIELLVVIGVIGILASVILISLNSTRAKAADSAIKADLVAVRTQAQIYLETYNSFGAGGPGACPLSGGVVTWAVQYDPKIQQLLTHAENQSGLSPGTACYAEPTSGSWAIAVQLKSSTTKAWCVDYLGTSKEVTITSNSPQTAMTSSGAARCQ